MVTIYDLQKNQDGFYFDETLDLKAELQERNPDIIDIKEIHAIGHVSYDDGLYSLEYDLSYTVTLPSTRSLTPVESAFHYFVSELFIHEADAKQNADLLDDEMLLVLEGDTIDLAESVSDNILLNIPLQVLTPKEKDGQELPKGEDWQVLTEESFEKKQAEKKAEENPFAKLKGLLDDD